MHSSPSPLSPLRSRVVRWLCSFLLPAAFLPAGAATIYWGSAVNDQLYDSYGSALDDSFTFELGTFGDFVPNDDNLHLWLENWKVLDRVTAPASSGWDSGSGFFSSSVSLLPDGASSNTGVGGFVFSPGEQAYIWVYNSQALEPDTEWALITNNASDGNTDDDWLIPALPLDCGCGSGAESLEWRLSTATQPDFGGVNDEYGPGNVSDTPPSFALQTAILPEPGGVLLLLSAAAFLGLRRQRAQPRS